MFSTSVETKVMRRSLLSKKGTVGRLSRRLYPKTIYYLDSSNKVPPHWEVRMRRVMWSVFFCFSCLASMPAQNKMEAPKSSSIVPRVTGSESSRLPVKRVVLYKNGVGYFEHSCRVHGNQDLAIDFTTAQLNDVLKSLTAVDLGDGRISSVRY